MLTDQDADWPNAHHHAGSHDTFNMIERVCSVFSLLGCFFIIFTFCFSKRFRKPINRLAFFATFGNLATNVATLMGRSFVDKADGAGCQVQAFLIQMFMPADAFWVLAMAFNVFLIFEHQYDAHKLRSMEKFYFLGCYGLTFITALVYCFVSTPTRGKMYGNATLWCWISPKWDIFRIATFYGPVWVSIGFTFFIYLRAGRDIYKNHRQIKKFHISSSYSGTVDETMQSRKITEVSVTHEMANRNGIGLVDLERNNRAQERSGDPAPPRVPPNAYSVTISADTQRPPETPDGENLARTTTITGGLSGSANTGQRTKSRQNNSAIWHYTKCALFFFTALLITWIPSSCNRVYSVVHHNQTVKVLELMGAGVLPLQGFWNAVIYAVTSWKACGKFFGEDVKDWFSGDPESGNKLRRDGSHYHHSTSRVIIGQVASVGINPFHKMGGRTGLASPETESMEELAACGSRRSSYGMGSDGISKDVR
ncbi:hypothetical protein B0T09DRAFT_78089 [Sordaria sp. MPI-SDFR-AT-0083]|nr:hypothetical protein B0T09DRAFT_78089 [Sordaria sp. MPI-SDFR-AT-0083]